MEFFNIVIMGTGGTGGALLNMLGQFLSGEDESKYCITVIDGDSVEEKNLKRQPFFIEDIGENKALAISTYLNELNGLNIAAVPRYITDTSDLSAVLDTHNKVSYEKEVINILFGCVDNNQAREVMHKYFEGFKTPKNYLVYIDSGNEYDYGEVVFGVKESSRVISPDKVYYFPELFSEEMTPRTEMSCTELNEAAPQHLATNNMAANICFSAFAMLYTHGVLPSGIVHFNSFKFFEKHVPYTGGKL